ncbi:LysR family transcriptional regulator [Salsipaludibacter albus]|uniref:LysR family transcriptional regulator n=1 Tax=Salsipaludibacter albus TaxID=2849650 RepID=UPI001EE404C5|nr:LysR family transcriptional regulator [Salsipaludibacter albus]MBY5162752.1 LysR family transcriptional regulator [Salsipaludibacter albus]
MLDLRRLRLLRELSRRGTLAKVAQSLSYSPSAVSQQLSKLQEEVGVTLLEPDGRGVALTPEARLLVRHTDAVFARLEQAESELAAAGNHVTGTLRVGTFQSVAHALLPDALDILAQRHPRLRVEAWVLEPAESVPAVITEDLDVAVDEEYPNRAAAPDEQLDRQLALDDPLQLVVPAAWGPATVLEDMAERPWVFEPRGTMAHAWSVAFCRDAGFEPDVRFAFNDLVLRLRFASTGHAATILPALAGAAAAPDVLVRPLPRSPVRRISTVVRRGRVIHPAIGAFRTALRESADRFAQNTGRQSAAKVAR